MPAGMVELLHVESGRVIVRVSAGSGAALVSALGEAASAELAEDRARQRLHQPVGAVSAAANHGTFTKYELWVILKLYVNYYFVTFSKVVHKY